VEWKRHGEICRTPYLFVIGVEFSDTNQNLLGNCLFIAACAFITLNWSFFKIGIIQSRNLIAAFSAFDSDVLVTGMM
ncbi:unnamed protein product, partial [Protopolystoma xenopodis]